MSIQDESDFTSRRSRVTVAQNNVYTLLKAQCFCLQNRRKSEIFAAVNGENTRVQGRVV